MEDRRPERAIKAGGLRQAGWWLIALLVMAFLLGGGSRSDIVSLIVLRPLSAIAFVVALAMTWRARSDGTTVPLAILGCWFALIALQIIPLPPGVWTQLPGREVIAETYSILRIAPGWKPLSVEPMATLNSLMAMFVPLAVLMFFASADQAGRLRAMVVVVGLVGISALFGIAQVVGGREWLYLYRVTNEGFPVGFFANRNHQAAIIAATIPVLLALTVRRGSEDNSKLIRWGGRLAALALAAVAVMTGSRAGTLLAIAGLVGAALVFSDRSAGIGPEHRARRAMARLAVPAILLLGMAAMFFLSSGTAFERMAEKDSIGDLRFQILPTVWRIIVDGFPFGFGFGTFPEIYKMYEPTAGMIAQYVNRAHNDWIEIALEGGLLAVALALSMAGWVVSRIWRLRATLLHPGSVNERLRSASAMGLALLVAASLFDYPLRTPAGAAVLAMLIGCLSISGRRT